MGEIYIRGPTVINGYYENEEATAEVIDREGWLRSGDIGYYDDDGDLFIVDRAKEVINCGGHKIISRMFNTILES